MKKKAIEKVPYLKLKKVSRKKGAKHIAVTAIKNIDGEDHLFVEIYKNEKGEKDVPVVRTVLAKNDFGNYYPERNGWTREKILNPATGRTIWKGYWQDKEGVLERGEDLERIKKYCGTKIYGFEGCWQYIQNYEERITTEERRKSEQRKYERRQQALNDRIAHTRELPREEILEYADNRLFRNKHYLYYKKHGSFVRIACSKCGGVEGVRWKAKDTFEGQFEKRIEEPREGRYGTCPLCEARGEYKCQGKAGKMKGVKKRIFLGQKYKENGLVMRYIEVEKVWNLGEVPTKKGMEMYNASEELRGVEIARAYFEPDKKTQIDYHKHSYYSGEDFWDDCNLYGMANITIGCGAIMKETYDEMKGTMFRYSALEEYARAAGEINPIDYLKRYKDTPQIEMLVKLGLTETVNEMVKCRYGVVENEHAKRPDIFLGIRAERVRRLITCRGDIEILKVMQMEKRMNQNWTDEQIGNIAETGLGRGRIEQAIKYMTVQKLLNRIGRYAGCEYGTGCVSAKDRIQETARTYTDYLNMSEELGYDLRDTVRQQPRDLRAAHDKAVLESNQKEMDKHISEKEREYPDIRNKYRRIRNIYYYEDEEYLIRPARSAGEIIVEGRTLHHCVGGNDYLRKHDSGQSYILMLRIKKDPEMPYITIEMDPERKRIIQWYGMNDRKPDKERIGGWLKDYLKYLNEKERIRVNIA